VTVCVQGWAEILGEIVNGTMRLDKFGYIVQNAWFDLPRHYPHIQLDAFCIMPNHVHGIIVLDEPRVGAGLDGQPILPDDIISAPGTTPDSDQTRPYGGDAIHPGSRLGKRHPLSEILRAFKSFSARRINGIRNMRGVPVWQRNYYETIIRDENHYNRIRTYIVNNPQRWQEDPLHPSALRHQG